MIILVLIWCWVAAKVAAVWVLSGCCVVAVGSLFVAAGSNLGRCWVSGGTLLGNLGSLMCCCYVAAGYHCGGNAALLLGRCALDCGGVVNAVSLAALLW